jgi:DNA gyrase subunit A
LLGFQKALQNLDAVIETIRAAKNPAEARAALTGETKFAENPRLEEVVAKWSPRLKWNGQPLSRFDFSERQAQAIIELQLQRLTGMEQQKIIDELAEIQRMIAEYLEILGSEKVLRALIIKELREVQKDFGDERRTEIVEDAGDIKLEDLIKQEEVVVTVTHGGYLKRTSLDTFRRQTRGGKGRKGMETRGEDVVEHMMVANTHSYVLIFTSMGRLYWLKVYEIPDAGAASKGKHIKSLVNLQEDETVREFLAVKEFVPEKYVVMATKYGIIKKCALTEFDNPMARGIIAIGLKEGDELIAAKLSSGDNLIFLATRNGMAIKFKEEQVRAMGRPAAGVTSMDLRGEDYIVGMEAVTEDDLILAVSEKGFGKRTRISEYRLQSRAGKGVINMKVAPKTGPVLAALAVAEDTDVIIITEAGKLIRTEAADIRRTGRSASGVKLVTMDDKDDRVAAACVVLEANGENGDDEQANLDLGK